jgi:hypothetical protein
MRFIFLLLPFFIFPTSVAASYSYPVQPVDSYKFLGGSGDIGSQPYNGITGVPQTITFSAYTDDIDEDGDLYFDYIRVCSTLDSTQKYCLPFDQYPVEITVTRNHGDTSCQQFTVDLTSVPGLPALTSEQFIETRFINTAGGAHFLNCGDDSNPYPFSSGGVGAVSETVDKFLIVTTDVFTPSEFQGAISSPVQSSGFNEITVTPNPGDSSTSTDLSIVADYTLELTEIQSNQPTLISYRLAYLDQSPLEVTQYQTIPALTSQLNENILTTTLFENLPNGTYAIEVRFSNQAQRLAGEERPLPNKFWIGEYEVEDGVVTSSQVDPIYTGLPDPDRYQNCGLTDLAGCLINAGLFLFVPESGVIGTAFNTISQADNPLIDSAVQSFETVTGVQDAESTGDPWAYTLSIDTIGLEVEMLSADTVTPLFGDTLPLFRMLMVTAMWFGFIGMIIHTVWRRIGEGDDSFDGSFGGDTVHNKVGKSGKYQHYDLDLRN